MEYNVLGETMGLVVFTFSSYCSLAVETSFPVSHQMGAQYAHISNYVAKKVKESRFNPICCDKCLFGMWLLRFKCAGLVGTVGALQYILEHF